MWKNISPKAKDFVKICLNKNSSKRPSAKEALNHPWFANVIKDIHNNKKIKIIFEKKIHKNEKALKNKLF